MPTPTSSYREQSETDRSTTSNRPLKRGNSTPLSGLDGSEYAGANNTCDGSSTLPYSANVVAVNDKCGTSGALDDWRTKVKNHEQAHEASLHSCLRSSRTNQKLVELEKITGTQAFVDGRITGIWEKFIEDVLDHAMEANLPSMTSQEMWHYRHSGTWEKGMLTSAAHGGTQGC